MACARFLIALLLPVAALAADLPDVTLQPWTVRTIDYTPGSYGATHSLTDPSGLVVLYSTDSFGGAPPQISTDFGATWKRLYQVSLGLRTQQIRVLDYVSSDSTALTGNGYFLGSWVENGAWINGLVKTNGDRLGGYDHMAVGGGLIVGIESYSTYVSSDNGVTWTPYLNPFSTDGVNLVSFNRIFFDGSRFIAVSAKGTSGYLAFQGSTWRSNDGVSWHQILASDAVCMDSQGRLVLVNAGTVYDLVEDALVVAHAEFPAADGNIDYHRIDGRIYVAKNDLLYYSDDKGVTRYRTGFPAQISAVWANPDKNGQHVVQVLVSDKRVFSSVPVTPLRTASTGVTLQSIEMRPMLTFEATAGTTVIIEASSTPEGPWLEVTRISAAGGSQVWNDNRPLAKSLFYRARSQ